MIVWPRHHKKFILRLIFHSTHSQSVSEWVSVFVPPDLHRHSLDWMYNVHRYIKLHIRICCGIHERQNCRLQLVINIWPPAFFLLIHITWHSIFPTTIGEFEVYLHIRYYLLQYCNGSGKYWTPVLSHGFHNNSYFKWKTKEITPKKQATTIMRVLLLLLFEF